MDRDADLIAELQAIGQEWWAKHIEGDEAPEPDGSLDDLRARLTLHPKDNGQMLTATPELDALARDLAQARAAQSQAEAQVESLELQMKNVIGDASGITGADWGVTWKASKASKATDWKAVCQAADVSQSLIEKFTREKKGARRFLFKSTF